MNNSVVVNGEGAVCIRIRWDYCRKVLMDQPWWCLDCHDHSPQRSSHREGSFKHNNKDTLYTRIAYIIMDAKGMTQWLSNKCFSLYIIKIMWIAGNIVDEDMEKSPIGPKRKMGDEITENFVSIILGCMFHSVIVPVCSDTYWFRRYPVISPTLPICHTMESFRKQVISPTQWSHFAHTVESFRPG